VLALRHFGSWEGQSGVGFGRRTPVYNTISDRGYVHVISARPRANINRLKADGPHTAKKDEDAQSDEKEMGCG
jgi:hypothetical protein